MVTQPKPEFVSIKNLLMSGCSFLAILLLVLLSYAYRMGYLGRLLVLINANFIELPTDNLSSRDWWKKEVEHQVFVSQNRQYETCLFGDSISSGIGNTLGKQTYNFALPGMSTISQIEQLKALTAVNLRCQNVIIAIGTNDADYRTMNYQFFRNMKQIISIVKRMEANPPSGLSHHVILLPAFYSTLTASHDITRAGTIERVEEINALIRQVASTEKVLISNSGVQLLYNGQALKENLTTDGVHLNEDGKKIYREALLKILKEF